MKSATFSSIWTDSLFFRLNVIVAAIGILYFIS